MQQKKKNKINMKVLTTKEGLEIAIQLYYLHVIIKSNSMIALLLIEKNKFSEIKTYF